MLGKVCSLARALATILAVVAGFIAIPGLDTTLVIIVLGLIAGIAYTDDSLRGLLLIAIGLPIIGAVLKQLPMLGDQLSGVAANVGIGAASAAATGIAISLYRTVVGDVTGLTK